jgi:hypothetical protein
MTREQYAALHRLAEAGCAELIRGQLAALGLESR